MEALPSKEIQSIINYIILIFKERYNSVLSMRDFRDIAEEVLYDRQGKKSMTESRVLRLQIFVPWLMK